MLHFAADFSDVFDERFPSRIGRFPAGAETHGLRGFYPIAERTCEGSSSLVVQAELVETARPALSSRMTHCSLRSPQRLGLAFADG